MAKFAFRRGEKVDKAAVGVGRLLYTGTTHSEAADKAEKDNGKWHKDLRDLGFTTSDKRIVGRAEAYKVADRANQVDNKSVNKANETWPHLKTTYLDAVHLKKDE